MSNLSQADAYLLEEIRRGDADGWAQLVESYEGRLIAFAQAQSGSRADAEDLVQDTFVNFLKGLKRFRGEASIETYLFTILRRRIIDQHRGRRIATCRLGDLSRDEKSPGAVVAADQPTASWYVRRDEAHNAHRDVLCAALGEMVRDAQESENLTALIIVEGLFYAGRRNKEVAALLDLDEAQVGLTKHRWIKRLRQAVGERLAGGAASDQTLWESPEQLSGMIGEVWEALRPSCPKRSTIGRYLLGTLEDPWRQYVHYHVEQLGCRFCEANLDDLRTQTDTARNTQRSARLFESTIGFLKPA